MTITNGYTDRATLKDYMTNATSATDTAVDLAVNAASRAIDGYCQRRFWLDPTPVARTFVPDGLLVVKFSSDPLAGDIGSLTGLVVRTDAGGDGVFETTWAASDFQLLPVNAASAWPEAAPWTAMRAVGTKTFPWLVNTWLTRLDRVQVTARWGWPAVPDAVTQACLIKAARVYARRTSPQGVVGFNEFGPIRISKGMDPDVCDLLDPYRRTVVLVG